MSMKDLQQDSYLYGSNAVFIEELYARYLQNEEDVDEHWRRVEKRCRELSELNCR